MNSERVVTRTCRTKSNEDTYPNTRTLRPRWAAVWLLQTASLAALTCVTGCFADPAAPKLHEDAGTSDAPAGRDAADGGTNPVMKDGGMPAKSCEKPTGELGATEECFTFPAPARPGNGACKAGTITCSLDTHSTTPEWGSCEGEIGPGPRDCSSPNDNDCDGKPDDTECGCTTGTVQSCYTGPAATLDVGPCHAGSQVCVVDPSGTTTTWGPCTGEVVPAPADTCEPGNNAMCTSLPNVGCTCLDGQTDTSACTGTCISGTRTCVDGNWGACAGATDPTACTSAETEIGSTGVYETCSITECSCSAPLPTDCTASNGCPGYYCGGGACEAVEVPSAWSPTDLGAYQASFSDTGGTGATAAYAGTWGVATPLPNQPFEAQIEVYELGSCNNSPGSSTYIMQVACSSEAPSETSCAESCVTPFGPLTTSSQALVFDAENFYTGATAWLSCPGGSDITIWHLGNKDQSGCSYQAVVNALISDTGECAVP
jgi:hypothetical protein